QWRWQSIANFSWNMLLLAYVTSQMLYIKETFFTLEKRDLQVQRTLQQKPLFAMLYRFTNEYVFKYSYGLNLLYFIGLSILRPNKLISLLDSFRVACFDAKEKARKSFLLQIFTHQVVYVISVGQIFMEMFRIVSADVQLTFPLHKMVQIYLCMF